MSYCDQCEELRAELVVLRNNQLGPVPEGPLKALGAWVADHTDDDTWPDAEQYLNAALAEFTAERERADRAEDSFAWAGLQITAVTAERDALRERADRAEAELERERMRLVACSAVALSNTAETAAKVREMRPDYDSASVRDVAAAVDREMALRERVARLVGAIEDALAANGRDQEAANSLLRTALGDK